jgi:FkbM family methyltransferase
MRLLLYCFGQHPRAVLLEQAVGELPGVQTLYINTRAPTLSTLCFDWVRALNNFPEFRKENWDQRLQIKVTTLDTLIEKYGEPVFCKIDVEGGELDVLRGLSVPPRNLSFEYITPIAERALKCIDRLGELGDYEYNWTRGEGCPLQFAVWLPPDKMKDQLKATHGGQGSGDVYARRQDSKKR